MTWWASLPLALLCHCCKPSVSMAAACLPMCCLYRAANGNSMFCATSRMPYPDTALQTAVYALEDSTVDQLTACCRGQVSGISAAPGDCEAAAASSSADGSVKLWAASGGALRVLSTLRSHAGRVHSVAWGPEAQELVSASQVLPSQPPARPAAALVVQQALLPMILAKRLKPDFKLKHPIGLQRKLSSP